MKSKGALKEVRRGGEVGRMRERWMRKRGLPNLG